MTQEPTITNERVDDIPVLMAQMEKMQVAQVLDEQFPTNGNWSGLSLGTVVSVWLAFILSESNHRLSHVRPWAEPRLAMIEACLGQTVRAVDFTDDRLAAVLDYLSDGTQWAACEDALNARMVRVYDLRAERTRIDSTTAKSYGEVIEGGLFQLGHSKDHRPDLGQVKINLSVLDPLGLPLTTTVVSGERADDPLYVPEIKRIQKTLTRRGLTHVGDSKMAALGTRGYVAGSGDYYLCPLPSTQMPEAELLGLLSPVWDGTQPVTAVLRPGPDPSNPACIAKGYEYGVELRATVDGQTNHWRERRFVVRSLALAESRERTLRARLAKAVGEIAALSEQRQGKKRLSEQEANTLVERIVANHRVQGLIAWTCGTQTTYETLRRYGAREAGVREHHAVTIAARVEEAALAKAIQRLGWRVYATNQWEPQMSLEEAVLAYRAEYLVERGFGRLKGKPLSLTPLYLDSDDRVTGLIRLMMIGLRVLTLLEFCARRTLGEEGARLAGIYPGNPKRATARPTAEMMLRAFTGLTLTFLTQAGRTSVHPPSLNTAQRRILELFGFSTDVYLRLGYHFSELPLNLSEP